MLPAVRVLCSVAAAFASLVQELRKASGIAMACACSPVFVVCAHAMVVEAPPAGLISAAPLAPAGRRKVRGGAAPADAVKKQPLVVAPPQAVLANSGRDVERERQAESKKKKKEAWVARRRPTRLVIPVADDAGEVAAGWEAAAAAPVKEADMVVEGEGFRVASRAGPRHAMEDGYAVITDDKNGGDSQLAFYGVFDGHGGRASVDFVADRLGKNVVSAVLAAEASSAAPEEQDAVSAAIRAAYLATDSELLAQLQDVMSGGGGGACAATALVKGDDLYVAHLGDCRAVLGRRAAAAAVALTADHTCARDDERSRIERGGGFVSRSGSGVWRVQGSLAVSRSFGDVGLKQWVIAEPAVARVPLDAGCEFLVMASDGLWDKVSNQEAVDAVARSRATACRELVDMARRRGSRDDVTVMVVDLQRFVR